MDMNKFLADVLAAQQQSAEALARMADNSNRQLAVSVELLKLNKQIHERGTAVLSECVTGTLDSTAVDLASGKVETTSESLASDVKAKAAAAAALAEKQAADAAAAQAEAAKAAQELADKEAAAKAAAAQKKKAPSIDEARAALKAYAAIEGNAAAMALLEKFGATSVSSLDEGKREEFIGACK